MSTLLNFLSYGSFTTEGVEIVCGSVHWALSIEIDMPGVKICSKSFIGRVWILVAFAQILSCI